MWTDSKNDFFLWLEDGKPELLVLFDLDQACFRVEAFRHYLNMASPAEAQLARFVASVWFGGNRRLGKPFANFDLVDAISRFDTGNREWVIEWIRDPIWP